MQSWVRTGQSGIGHPTRSPTPPSPGARRIDHGRRLDAPLRVTTPATARSSTRIPVTSAWSSATPPRSTSARMNARGKVPGSRGRCRRDSARSRGPDRHAATARPFAPRRRRPARSRRRAPGRDAPPARAAPRRPPRATFTLPFTTTSSGWPVSAWKLVSIRTPRIASAASTSSTCTCWARPAARAELCDARSDLSTSTTARPRAARWNAVLAPSAPDPMTMASATRFIPVPRGLPHRPWLDSGCGPGYGPA